MCGALERLASGVRLNEPLTPCKMSMRALADTTYTSLKYLVIIRHYGTDLSVDGARALADVFMVQHVVAVARPRGHQRGHRRCACDRSTCSRPIRR
mmetsp:Transcript_38325/g.93917  ORF Transcript_38325/g.93917 Transcript_38325/m.93917 type:complete len:96 (+) Transcript_38325:130-417(+)